MCLVLWNSTLGSTVTQLHYYKPTSNSFESISITICSQSINLLIRILKRMLHKCSTSSISHADMQTDIENIFNIEHDPRWPLIWVTIIIERSRRRPYDRQTTHKHIQAHKHQRKKSIHETAYNKIRNTDYEHAAYERIMCMFDIGFTHGAGSPYHKPNNNKHSICTHINYCALVARYHTRSYVT